MGNAATVRSGIGQQVVQLSASPEVKEGVERELGASTAEHEEARKQKNQRHEQLRQKAAQRQADEETAKADILPAYEDIASLEVEMIDGKIMVLEQPLAGTLNYKIAVVLGTEVGNVMLANIARALCFLSKIDDDPVVMNNKVDFIQLQNRLGEATVDWITATVNEHFPYFGRDQLKIVKKTLRTPPSGR